MSKDKREKKAGKGKKDTIAALVGRLEAATARLDALERALRAKGAETAATDATPSPAGHVSPFAPDAFPALPVIEGVRFAAVEAGVRYKGRLDVMLAEIEPGATVAGVFTKSETRSAPVLWCQERLAEGPAKGPQVIVVNSGNSNAFTGKAGVEAVEAVARAAAKATAPRPPTSGSPPPA